MPRKPRRRSEERRGQGTPDFRKRPPLPMLEIPTTVEAYRPFGGITNATIRNYALGECRVIVTIHKKVHHLSISHPDRYPTWDEIAEARYRCVPDGLNMAMHLPPRAEYVNLHPNCFQLVETPPPYSQLAGGDEVLQSA